MSKIQAANNWLLDVTDPSVDDYPPERCAHDAYVAIKDMIDHIDLNALERIRMISAMHVAKNRAGQ